MKSKQYIAPTMNIVELEANESICVIVASDTTTDSTMLSKRNRNKLDEGWNEEDNF